MSSDATERYFAVIFVLGAPGAGKGTLCAHLAQNYHLSHFSVGDNLRTWMRANPDLPLARTIQDKLAHQGFLTSEELSPFIGQAIQEAISKPNIKGILLDGFPRCMEQVDSFRTWPFETSLPLRGSKPDLVLSIKIARETAEARYLARARDGNDSEEKFERRFVEYEREGPPVEETYRERGLLIDIDGNMTQEENIGVTEERLQQNELWQTAVVHQGAAQSSFFKLKASGETET